MFTSIKRIFKSGWLSFSRDGGLMAATCFIILIPILLVTFLFFSKNLSQLLISNIQEKADISVYFKENALEEDILRVKEEVSKIPEVKSVKYISKEYALENFVQRHKDDPVLMESLAEVGRNPFLAALNIQAFEANQYLAVANFLDSTLSSSYRELIEKVDYYQRKPVIERIFAMTSGIKETGIFLSVVLAIVAILITFNTIRLAILNQREEIKIQRLVGASNWFIRGPFLVQGVIAGMMSTLVCLSLTALVCWIFSPRIEILFSDLNVWGYFTGNFFIILLVQLATGIGLGIISSTIAIRKYLKV